MTATFYTFEHDGERFDLECPSESRAKEWIDAWFAARFDDEPMKNGETREDECFVIGFRYNDDGEPVEVSREKHRLFYEYYHGDFKEHSTY